MTSASIFDPKPQWDDLTWRWDDKTRSLRPRGTIPPLSAQVEPPPPAPRMTPPSTGMDPFALMQQQQSPVMLAGGGFGLAGEDSVDEGYSTSGEFLDEETGEWVTAQELQRRREVRAVQPQVPGPVPAMRVPAMDKDAFAAKEQMVQQNARGVAQEEVQRRLSGLGGGLSKAYNTRIPVVSDAVRDVVKPVVGASWNAGVGAPAGLALDALGIKANLGKIGANLAIPETAGDFALEALPYSGSALKALPKAAGLIDDAGLAATKLLGVGDEGMTAARYGSGPSGGDDYLKNLEYSLKKIEGKTPDEVKAELARQGQVVGGQIDEAYDAGRANQDLRFGNTAKDNLAQTADEMAAAQKALQEGGLHAGVPISPHMLDDLNLVDELTAAIGLTRQAKATLDLSAPGRQGLRLAFRHPKEWVESWVPMIKAWSSERGMEAVNRQIQGTMTQLSKLPLHGDNNLADAIHFYQVGPNASGLERVPGFESAGKGILSSMVRSIPGIENAERAYATFLNYQKAMTFKNMIPALRRAGDSNPEHYMALGRIIDHATGYGAAPLKGRLAGEALFSQRFFTSSFQFLTDPIVEALVKRDMGAAKAATENLVAFAGGMAGILALGNETGAWDATLDPRSSDFGKIRIGPQRIDFGAGILPIIRTAGRIATGEAKATTGGVYDIKPGQEMLNMLRNKLAPIPSEIVDRVEWANMSEGDRRTAPEFRKPTRLGSLEFFQSMFMPLIIESVKEAWNETGNPIDAGRAGIAELVGGGTNTYGSAQVAQAETAKQQFGQEYDDLYASDQAALNKQLADSGQELHYRDRDSAWWSARNDAMSRWHADLDASMADDPFVQHALEVDQYGDLERSLVSWAQESYGIARAEAEAAVGRFLGQTKLDDYIKAYRKSVLAADPDFLKVWDEAYENDEAEDAPPKWAREFVTSGAGR